MTAGQLIPRRKLFDNPAAWCVRLSPDGRHMTWLAPFEGVMNVWIAPSDTLSAATPLTRTKGRPINWQGWTPDGRYVLFLNDETGDENWHTFAADPDSGTVRDLTPIKGINAQPQMWSRDVPGKIVVGINDRDPRWHDLYTIDVASGTRTLLFENTREYLHIAIDWQLRPRLARSTVPSGGSTYWRLESSGATEWLQVPYQDELTTWSRFFDQSDRKVLLHTSLGRETQALVWVDLDSGAETVVAAHPRFDMCSWIADPTTHEIEAAAIDAARQEWIHVTSPVATELELIGRALPDFEFGIECQTDDNRRWIISAYKAEQPATYFLLDRDKQTLTELFRARPALANHRLAPMRPIETKTRDGLDLVSYLTLPADVSGEKPDAPLPMVLVVHGGPWSRDTYGYRGDHQWLADRGYAVLSVNYRGSTGFGKSFVSAAEKQHAAKMHDDLIDMVEWAVASGIADRSKIAIFGASYGGYASFVGATFTPEVFCCSIPVVGITNLQTLLESMPPYWAGFAEFMYRSYGDPRTSEGRALLAERSPIHKVDAIRKPMLIFHGANDVRCKVAESDTIVAAMQAKGIPVTYVVYPDEGHGFQKPGNRLAYYAIAEAFLARHLGGACEPMGADLADSSHQIRAGAETVPGSQPTG